MRDRLKTLWRWLARVKAIEPTILMSLFVLSVVTWGFIELAEEVLEGDTVAFDEWVVQAMRQPDDLATPIGPPWLQEMGRDATAFGGVGCIAFFVAVVTVYLWLDRKLHMAAFLLVATSGGLVMSLLLKQLFSRPRPELVPHLSHVYTSSFPSGHSMLSAVTYLTLGVLLSTALPRRGLKFYVLAIAVMLSLVVGISRVYLGVHYPTDVLAGWAAGLAWALLCWVITRQLQQRGQIEKPHEKTTTLGEAPADQD